MPLAFITSLNDVPVTIFLTGPGVTTLPIQMLSYVEYYFDPTVSAISVLLMFLTIILMFLIEATMGLSFFTKSKMSYLQLKNLTASYDKEIVLNNLSLDIKKGELLSLLGSSGCGKTTTLRIVSGFLKPISGSVILDDMDISQNLRMKEDLDMFFRVMRYFPI